MFFLRKTLRTGSITGEKTIPKCHRQSDKVVMELRKLDMWQDMSGETEVARPGYFGFYR